MPATTQHKLNQCFRKLKANLPAWYSTPSMRDGSISVSLISMASSLSRFPSKLLSLMFAEPGFKGTLSAWAEGGLSTPNYQSISPEAHTVSSNCNSISPTL